VVLVSPDGVLGTVPFAALPGAKKGTYLIEDLALAVVPVPSAIPDLMKPLDKAARLAPSLLVIGDLRYEPEEGGAAPRAGEDTRSAPRTGREHFGPLPATRAEILAVEASFKDLFEGGASTALRKGGATKAAVRKALASVRYAHLATHGYFAPETVKSALAPDERRGVTGWHPLLLSGLALSDANRSSKEGEEDGILTALEVSEMDLSKLELAVLSACETGLGKVAGGEGILGMQRAFQIAGARSIVASLWRVDDKATQNLMQEFYAAAWNTKKVISRAEALRQAQLSMLKDGRRRAIGKEAAKVSEGEKPSTRLPPYFWAGFVLSGDWR
jgi:CHAT domain-containing protein